MDPVPLPTPTLTTERLLLRPFSDADAEAIWELQSDAEVLRYWDSPPWTDPARASGFIATAHRLAQEGTGARLAVELADGGTFLGWAGLSRWDPTHRSASITYCFHRRAWGRGFATEAAGALLAWAFETLDLNRVQGEADTRNAGSARVMEKLGFVLEGTLREDCVVDGVVSDSWVYGLLRRDWSARNPSGR